MVDITYKNFSLRQAIAQAVLEVSDQCTIDAIVNRKVPKGDVFEFSRAAGLLAIKKTADVIPDCHPLPIEFASIDFHIEGLKVHIQVEVHTIYKTGVEVEAMHGASITALCMYDMLKPIDKKVFIRDIELLSKKGGKNDFYDKITDLRCAVIVCSDSISSGKKQDKAGQCIVDKLTKYGVEHIKYEIIPDDPDQIRNKTLTHHASDIDLLIFTGGTGLSARDVTPDVIKPLLDKEIQGVMEAARNYGQMRMPYAMLSRGVAGLIGQMVVLTLPGSTRGADETMDALFPALFHLFTIIRGGKHKT